MIEYQKSKRDQKSPEEGEQENYEKLLTRSFEKFKFFKMLF